MSARISTDEQSASAAAQEADPFRIDGPAMVSFSGGRTSALMLRRVLDAHGGRLPSDVHVLFANTGKERPETLDFVRDCAEHWDIDVTWVERMPGPHKGTPHAARFREVDHGNASRKGEPFDQLIDERAFLPNPVTRFCTQELKIRPMRDWMRARGYEEWTNVVGIRLDEPRRIAKIRERNAKGGERWTVALPLVEGGVTESHVLAFWREQPFDLALRPWEGNCDLCFLKGIDKRVRVLRDLPDLGAWWVRAEVRTDTRFRSDTPDVAALGRIARQPMLPIFEEPAALEDCSCTD